MAAKLSSVILRSVTISKVTVPPPPLTYYLQDSFTAADDTTLASHSPEIGGAWTMFSGYELDSILIESNEVTRAVDPQPDAFGNARVFNDVNTIPTNNFAIQFGIKFMSDDFAELEMFRNGESHGNSDKFLTLDFFNSSSSSFANPWAGGGSTSAVFTQLNHVYVFRMVFTSTGTTTNIEYLVDNVSIGNSDVSPDDTAWFVGNFGFNLFDPSGLGVMRFTDMQITSL